MRTTCSLESATAEVTKAAATKVGVCYIVHDDHYFFAASIASFTAFGTPAFAFVSALPWHGEPGDTKTVERIAKKSGAKVIRGEWRTEEEQRAAAMEHLKAQGFTHALIPDTDEIIEPQLLQALLKIAEDDLGDRVAVEMDTYWKSAEYVIRPREQLTPVMLLNLSVVKNLELRRFSGGRPLLLNAEHGVLHHLSYAGPDERIERKIATWAHHNEVVDDWFHRVWKGWDGQAP